MRSFCIYLKLKEWGKEYGNIIGFKVGSSYAIVLNSYDVIQQALVKQGADFNDRPDNDIFSNALGKSGLFSIVLIRSVSRVKSPIILKIESNDALSRISRHCHIIYIEPAGDFKSIFSCRHSSEWLYERFRNTEKVCSPNFREVGFREKIYGTFNCGKTFMELSLTQPIHQTNSFVTQESAQDLIQMLGQGRVKLDNEAKVSSFSAVLPETFLIEIKLCIMTSYLTSPNMVRAWIKNREALCLRLASQCS